MTASKRGRSIELFFVDGDPDGMLTATIPFQWTGHVLVTSRTQLKQALDRPELERPGVYMLIGEVDEKSTLYIGETDEIRVRLKQHAAKKEWWSTAICISSNGEPLNKAHARYLESRIISDAKRLRKIELDNDQAPPERSLSEAALAHMEDFLQNIYLVLPALRFDFFTEKLHAPTSPPDETKDDGPIYFVMNINNPNISARARLVDGRFTVEKDSTARKKWVGTTTKQSTYAKLFEELVQQGILEEQGELRVYSRDYTFNSTSAAAAVTAGRPTSGPYHWKLEGTGKSYGDWESETLNQTSNEDE
jgi:predicted GIY-YIG superfamily endonuclease